MWQPIWQFLFIFLIPEEPGQYLRFIFSSKSKHVFKGKIDTINVVDVYEFYLFQFLGQCDSKYDSFCLLS